MLKIEVLGTGCAKCKKTIQLIKKEIKQMDIKAEIIKVEDINEISSYGVLMTPAVIINGEIKTEGKIPNKEDIRAYLS